MNDEVQSFTSSSIVPTSSFPLLLLLLLLAEHHIARMKLAALLAGHLQRAIPLGREFWWDTGELGADDLHIDGFGCLAAIDAAIGWHVAVVSADGDLHEIRTDDALVGWIDSDPAARGKE